MEASPEARHLTSIVPGRDRTGVDLTDQEANRVGADIDRRVHLFLTDNSLGKIEGMIADLLEIVQHIYEDQSRHDGAFAGVQARNMVVAQGGLEIVDRILEELGLVEDGRVAPLHGIDDISQEIPGNS